MNEFINVTSKQTNAKWRLLMSVSAASLLSVLPSDLSAATENQPTIWVELGGQLNQLTTSQDSYSPPFVAELLENPFIAPENVQRPPGYSLEEDGRVIFSPGTSDWLFSAAVRYGRANKSRNVHQETSPASPKAFVSIPVLDKYGTVPFPPRSKRFATTTSQTHSTDLLVDFQAGKDVGLGVFGSHGTSILSVGVRFAQFTSRSTARIDADPNFSIGYKYLSTYAGFPVSIKLPRQEWDLYSGKMEVSRSFSGLGPSFKWDSSEILIDSVDSESVTFDWGLNAALLFGRQKANAHHETVAHHGYTNFSDPSVPLPTTYQTAHSIVRSRSIIVPNIGGFAGLSMHFPNAKVSLGYRADFFFGAMDGGIDTRKIYDRDFYGPFATISIGLGG